MDLSLRWNFPLVVKKWNGTAGNRVKRQSKNSEICMLSDLYQLGKDLLEKLLFQHDDRYRKDKRPVHFFLSSYSWFHLFFHDSPPCPSPLAYTVTQEIRRWEMRCSFCKYHRLEVGLEGAMPASFCENLQAWWLILVDFFIFRIIRKDKGEQHLILKVIEVNLLILDKVDWPTTYQLTAFTCVFPWICH